MSFKDNIFLCRNRFFFKTKQVVCERSEFHEDILKEKYRYHDFFADKQDFPVVNSLKYILTYVGGKYVAV